jgi:hypothetical protein
LDTKTAEQEQVQQQQETTTKWDLVPEHVRLFRDGPLRAVSGRPLGLVRLCGIECEVRRASLRDYQRVEEVLGGTLRDSIKRGLSHVEMAKITALAVTPVDRNVALPPDALEWPLGESGAWSEIVRLFLGAGTLVLE